MSGNIHGLLRCVCLYVCTCVISLYQSNESIAGIRSISQVYSLCFLTYLLFGIFEFTIGCEPVVKMEGKCAVHIHNNKSDLK